MSKIQYWLAILDPKFIHGGATNRENMVIMKFNSLVPGNTIYGVIELGQQRFK